MSNEKEREKDTKEIVNWRTFGASIVLFGVGILLLSFIVPYLEKESVIRIVFNGIAEALLIVGAFDMFYEIWVRRKFKNEMAIMVNNAINADVTFLKEKLKGNVDLIIRNCIQAKLCNKEMAKIFYDGLIFPYMTIERFRKTFKYEIKLGELDEDIIFDKVRFGKSSYFKVVEELTFKKQLNIKNDMEFVVGLCLSDPQLEFYKSKDCIYRTIFRIKESEKEILQTTSLPASIFKIMVKINDRELTPTMTSYDNNKGIKIICKYEGEEINANEESELYVEVVTLHDKNVNFYTAYLYDPSFSPEIKLHYNDEMKDIFAVAHLTTSKGKDVIPKLNNDAKYISVEINEWVFPTSGVVFIWKACKK